MNSAYEKLTDCYESVKGELPFKPKVALVLGSGLGDYVKKMKVEKIISYHDIDGFPVSTVQGHKGQFVFGYVGNVPIVAMQGRVHYYEGYSMTDVVLPIRLMRLMGAEVLFLTNASGGVNYDYEPGDFMLIQDQIASFVPSPLIGTNIDELGARFPDMSEIYDEDLRKLIRYTASDLQLTLREGTYLQLTGPQYESPAEIRMYRLLGADAVGMSTACEAMAARHAGIRVCGISCVSNMASGLSGEELSHLDVQAVADRRAQEFERLVTRSIEKMCEDERSE